MTAEEWAEVRTLFDTAVHHTGRARDALLDDACRDREWLRREVAALLAAHDRAHGFLEAPAYDVAAHLLANPADGTLPEGRALGPYVIRREIGRGGMGIVYLADDTRLGRPVALKACGPSIRHREAQLRREARAAAALAHPGIATVYALEELEGELYLATEYVPGPTLRTMLFPGGLEPAMVLDIATQVARALAAAHAQHVVHGDLTPANVVRTATGTVKILDFGVARAGIGAPEETGRARAAAPGTPGYMAPEQIRDGEVTFQSDLFAFGVLVHELATGRRPFDRLGAPPLSGIEDDRLERLPPPFSGLSPILARCLRARPSDRYASTFQLVADLEPLQAGTRADGHVRAPAAAAAPLQPRWWWAFHQVLVSAVYVLMLYPAWLARGWLPIPWGSLFLGIALACATTGTTLRLNLWFTARFYAAEFADHRRRTGPWIRRSEGALAAVLLMAAFGIEADHPGVAVLFVTAAVALTVASLVIEPLTIKAAFESHGSPRH